MGSVEAVLGHLGPVLLLGIYWYLNLDILDKLIESVFCIFGVWIKVLDFKTYLVGFS